MNNLVKTEILGVGITNDIEENILEYVIESIIKPGKNYYIVTPNPEIVVYSREYKEFKDIINQARLALCDGTGLFIAGVVFNKKLRQRVTGVDFMLKLCKSVSDVNSQHKKKPITVGFLGAGPKIAERTAECLKTKYSSLKVNFIGEEWGEKGFVWNERSKVKDQKSKLQLKNQNLETNYEMRSFERKRPISTSLQLRGSDSRIGLSHSDNLTMKQFNNETIDILFVAFGFPKQEEWMASHINKIPVKVMVGVGGSFDYISGNISRAPFIVRLFGFEWLYRLIREPWRFRRQMALLKFSYLVFKERLSL